MKTFESLLETFDLVRRAQYRDDNDEAAARMESIEFTIREMLEALRELHDK